VWQRKRNAIQKKVIHYLKNPEPQRASIEELLAIGRRIAAIAAGRALIDHAEFLYDERGFPK